MSNEGINAARQNDKDEFYTQLTDIEKEMKHYKSHFKDKVVYCNCDDPYESNFFKYFALNFNHLGLKKLITTSYVDSPFANTLFEFVKKEKNEKSPYAIEINKVEDLNEDGAVDMTDVEILLKNDQNASHELKENGEFDSPECIKFLEESDIVVTNPPFSQFKDFSAMLMKYNKDFIILGNMNAVTNRDVRPYILMNRLWYGPSISSGDRWFQVPDYYELTAANSKIDENGNKFVKVKGVRWFTNLPHNKRNEELILYQKYSPEIYPKYDNYNAIEVSQVKNIPKDYSGEMGVPITFLDKYNPNQFELIGFCLDCKKINGDSSSPFLVNGEKKYRRIVIKNKKLQ